MGKSCSRLSRTRCAVYVTVLACAPFLVYLFGYRELRFFKVPSSSMAPTLYPNDYIATTNDRQYRRGDLIVLADPENKTGYIVKRIVGVAGDTLAIENGVLTINGKYASEPYLQEPMERDMAPVTVPEGGVMVMGDNRNESEDSSTWQLEPDPKLSGNDQDARGWQKAVPVKSIIGKVRYRYLPLSRRGVIKSFPLTNSEGR